MDKVWAVIAMSIKSTGDKRSKYMKHVSENLCVLTSCIFKKNYTLLKNKIFKSEKCLKNDKILTAL